MKKISFILLFAIVGCKTEITPVSPPKNLIPKDTFQLVLMEMTMLETYIEKKYSSQLFRYREIMKRSGDSLLATHGINFKRYQSSMLYYVKNKSLIDSIYTGIMSELAVKKAKLDVKNKK